MVAAENGGREKPRERRPGWSQGAGDAEDETTGGESVGRESAERGGMRGRSRKRPGDRGRGGEGD